MNASRRTLLQLLPLMGASFAFADDRSISSFATPFDQLPVQGNGARPILNGVTHAGTHLEVHETTLAPGKMPHPPHHHVREEMFLLSRGTLEITINGKATILGPGSAAFAHSGEEHSVKNVGQQDAQYFVVAINTDTGA